MNLKKQLHNEIDKLPESLLGEVFDFVQFLEYKKNTNSAETYIQSESSLSKDWNKPEEDEAWENL